MNIDALVVHGDDIGKVVGEFYGSPIRELSNFSTKGRQIDDMQQRVRDSFGLDSAPIELLPGEVVKDNVIRRETTAEVVGEDFYEPRAAEGISGLQAPDYWDDYEMRRA